MLHVRLCASETTEAARPAARIRTEERAARPGEKQGSPVNLASRSGVLDKLSVTAEMSTTRHGDTGSEVGFVVVVVGGVV